MQTFSVTSEPWQEVLDRLPAELDLDALAFSSGALKRRREVGDGATLLRLAMARGPGGLSLNQTAAWAAMQGLARLSDPAVKYRAHPGPQKRQDLWVHRSAPSQHCLRWQRGGGVDHHRH